MKKKISKYFGKSIERIKNSILALKYNKGLILLDHKKRENEGDLIFSSQNINKKQIAFSIRNGSGIVCLCITEKLRKKLKLPMMVKKNTSSYNTAFTVTIEAAKGVSTGVSAQDRLKTIKTAISKHTKPNEINRPGHIFPVRAHKGGILKRAGHTEAGIEIVKLASLQPTCVICEITNKNGSMAKSYEINKFSQKNNMYVLKIKDIINYIIINK
ncbi:3,4-dihydroxy-2-butanone-4-phosphate synthase [Buchnera aphidicola (Mollitrichosiphum nigrofasciatum)]|uniref:3,4-dihydroxy-2-butanone-4-phosphate synthase n=1 Tax=Buchnera aphidicola TaxID=9 RepID=UPI0031B88A23